MMSIFSSLIQDESGHCSVVDAYMTMRLINMKIDKGYTNFLFLYKIMTFLNYSDCYLEMLCMDGVMMSLCEKKRKE